MLDFITKEDYWAALSDPFVLARLESMPHPLIDLKHIQDAWMFHRLKDFRNKKILEVGGGNSRMLRLLDQSNELWNADEFKGLDGGPKAVPEIAGVKTVRRKVGDFSDEIPAEYFDIVFSVSVIEHIPDAGSLKRFWKDHARLMRPDAQAFHAIDIYVGDQPMKYYEERLDGYTNDPKEAGMAFVASPAVERPAVFRSRYASNPDLAMWHWNRAVPAMAHVRTSAQSTSLKLILRRA